MAKDSIIASPRPASKSIYDSKKSQRLKFLTGLILVSSFILKLLFSIRRETIGSNLNSYSYSEFLINYHGGFVRRGLSGEILYQAYQFHSFPLKVTLLCISCIVFLWVGAFFYNQFKKQNLCWWLLLSPLFLNFTFNLVRKDYILYAILIAIIYLLRPSSRDITNKSIACILVLFSLLIHEAFLFWGVVLYTMLLLTDKRHKVLNYSLIAIPLIAVVIISFFKGSTEVAHAIVSSWNSALPNQPLYPMQDNSIGAIGWDTLNTFLFHFRSNRSIVAGGGGIILIPIMLVTAYYLFTNYMVYFGNGTVEKREAKRLEIALLYPMICVSLIPMLTILSCDPGRIFQYATITTFSAFLILPQQRVFNIFPKWYKDVIMKFNNWLDSRFPPTKTLLLFILMTLAISATDFNLNTSWTESVAGSIISNCRRICTYIAQPFLL